jgi:hypothetical protein
MARRLSQARAVLLLLLLFRCRRRRRDRFHFPRFLVQGTNGFPKLDAIRIAIAPHYSHPYFPPKEPHDPRHRGIQYDLFQIDDKTIIIVVAVVRIAF